MSNINDYVGQFEAYLIEKKNGNAKEAAKCFSLLYVVKYSRLILINCEKFTNELYVCYLIDFNPSFLKVVYGKK